MTARRIRSEDEFGTTDRWRCVHFRPRSEAEQLSELREAGFFVAMLSDDALGSEEALFAALQHAFSFPSYFGRNWSAVRDCLGDLEWSEAKGYVLLVDDSAHRRITEPLGKLIEVWLAAAQEWSAERVPFHLVILI